MRALEQRRAAHGAIHFENGDPQSGRAGSNNVKKILISADAYERRAAIVEQGQAVEVYIERDDRRSLIGNVYLARVDNVLPGMEAAFVDAGLPKNAYLYVNDLVVDGASEKAKRSKKIDAILKNGQSVLVQVTKDPMGTKGARVTMEISLAGRFLVYLPDGDTGGVSKSLPDGERDRLRAIVKDLRPKSGGGLIVRTAARGARKEELVRDLELLEATWADIQAKAKRVRAPSLLHQEVDLPLTLVRDDLRVDVEELVVDDEATYERVRAYVLERSPELVDRLVLHKAATPLLRRYQIEEALRSTIRRRVDLPSGGYLLFDYAEAFTIIDVNTGRFVGKSRLEDTILANNLEAAREVARQLRLRDIGGMIIVDFIDMASKRNRDAVVECLDKELGRDRSKVYLTSISPLGLVEITRQNLTDGVREIQTDRCPTCHGEGRVLSEETLAIENLRDLRRYARLSEDAAFLVEAHARIAARMVGPGGRRLAELEAETGKHFSILAVEGVPVERCSVVRSGPVEVILSDALPVSVGQELRVQLREPHMFQASDAVAYLEHGHRIVVAGGGAYLGETQRVRVKRVGRLESHAELLDVAAITVAEVLDQIDPSSDIHEPERVAGDRVDLEERSRRRTRRTSAKPTAVSVSVTAQPTPASKAPERAAEPAKAPRAPRRTPDRTAVDAAPRPERRTRVASARATLMGASRTDAPRRGTRSSLHRELLAAARNGPSN